MQGSDHLFVFVGRWQNEVRTPEIAIPKMSFVIDSLTVKVVFVFSTSPEEDTDCALERGGWMP